MKHRIAARTLGRERAHRQAMLKNLATALILHERVVTTEGKAKEVRRFVEPLITRAKINSVASQRALTAALPEKGAAKKLVVDLGPKYKDRPGGYVRLTKIGTRPGDGARRVAVELV
jgi:large subunit ribosomal protein L17